MLLDAAKFSPGQVATSKSNARTAAHASVRPSQKWASRRPGCASPNKACTRRSSALLHMSRARALPCWRGARVASTAWWPAGRLHSTRGLSPVTRCRIGRRPTRAAACRRRGGGDRRRRACAGAGRWPAGRPAGAYDE